MKKDHKFWKEKYLAQTDSDSKSHIGSSDAGMDFDWASLGC